MSKTYNAAIYLRLSRDDGDDEESQSITNQRDYNLAYINKQNDLIYIAEYIDDGLSGGNFERPGWQKLMKDIENKKINTIITKDLSRMGRDYIAMGNYIEKEFPEKGIRYIAINDDIDTLYETPGLDYLQFKLMFNDFFLKDTSKKIRKIMKGKKEQGQYTGWKGIYGYQRDPNDKHKLVVDENVRHIIVRMFDLAKKGYGTKKIADIFSQEGIPNPSVYANLKRGKKTTSSTLWCDRTIGELLENPTYIGNLTQGRRKKVSYKSKKEVRVPKEEWIIIENTHEPIIDKETFYTVQEVLKKKKNNPQGKNNHLLRGLLYCKECGHKIGINRSLDKSRRYCVCNFYASHSKFKLCTPHSMNYDKLETAVLNEIKSICNKFVDSTNFENAVEEAKKENSIRDKIKQEIEKIDIKINQITNNIDRAYLDNINNIITLEQYQRVVINLNQELNGLKTRKEDLTKELEKIGSNDSKKEKEETIKKMKEFLSFDKPSEDLLVNLIDKIVIGEDKTVEINYKFRID